MSLVLSAHVTISDLILGRFYVRSKITLKRPTSEDGILSINGRILRKVKGLFVWMVGCSSINHKIINFKFLSSYVAVIPPSFITCKEQQHLNDEF